MEYRIVKFDGSMKGMLPHPQQPFEIFGKLVPKYDGENWSVSEILLDSPYEKTYPNEVFDPADYFDNPEQAAFLAMLGDACVGSIRVCRRWNGNAFIDDLAIDRAHRRHGVGRMLMDAAANWGRKSGLVGLSLETQDDNLAACRFYIKYGFRLGGIDKLTYTDPAYRGETALYFYMDN